MLPHNIAQPRQPFSLLLSLPAYHAYLGLLAFRSSDSHALPFLTCAFVVCIYVYTCIPLMGLCGTVAGFPHARHGSVRQPPEIQSARAHCSVRHRVLQAESCGEHVYVCVRMCCVCVLACVCVCMYGAKKTGIDKPETENSWKEDKTGHECRPDRVTGSTYCSLDTTLHDHVHTHTLLCAESFSLACCHLFLPLCVCPFVSQNVCVCPSLCACPALLPAGQGAVSRKFPALSHALLHQAAGR